MSGAGRPASAPPEPVEAARELAARHAAARPRRGGTDVSGRADAARERVRERIAAIPARAVALSASAQWLLDNDYLVLRALRQVESDLPPRFARRLPRLDDGRARVEALARAAREPTDEPLDAERLGRFLEAYQQVAPLTLAELWALPVFLRLGTVEALLRALPEASRLIDAGSAVDRRVRAAVLTLHHLDREDWTVFVEDASRVERTLREDPAGVYPRLDEASRDRYRSEIERIAWRCPRSEAEVARAALDQARAAAGRRGAPCEARHVGHALVGAGREALERAVAARPARLRRLRRAMRRTDRALLAAATAALAAPPWALGVVAALRLSAGPWAAALAVPLAVLAWTSAEAVVRGLLTRLLPPRVLPKLDLEDGVPHEGRTLVAIPALVASEEAIAAVAASLERHYLGHRAANLGFALIADPPDAEAPERPEDAALRARLVEEVHALRARHPGGRFHLLLRARRWNPGQRRWMGWERKRGKLHELNRLLLDGSRGSFELLDLHPGEPFDYRYVLTLDADTVLPPRAGLRLLGAALHPLARPSLDERGRVRAGYTVLQPRVELRPEEAAASRFARWLAAPRGVDLYAHAVSEPIMDLTGEGIYAGKGLYPVAAFERALAGRVPENAVLSHDLFEGGAGRAALVSDVVVLEGAPRDLLAHLRRQARWIRGDWQLLPWLGPRPPHADGRGPNPLSWPARWVLSHNLLRSLLPIALLASLALAWLALPGSALAWTLALVALALAPTALAALPRRRTRRMRGAAPVASGAAGDLRRDAAELAFLPALAWSSVAAIARTLWRLAVSRRRLLTWQVDGPGEARPARRGVASRWRALASAPLAALAIGGLAAAVRPGALPVAAPFLAVWLVAPELAARLARPPRRAPAALPEADRRWLTRIARRTWLYFERFVGPDDHWLPPDHVQEGARGSVAHRTSPTNIGLMLATTLGARDLGFLPVRAAVRRLAASFASLARLARVRGHFLNWYDTRSLEPLPPRYLSFVDSGNLLGCLIAVKEGCLELPSEPVAGSRAWTGAAVLVELLEEACGPLMDGEERLATACRALRGHLVEAARDPHPASARLDARELAALERGLLAAVEARRDELGPEPLAEASVWLERLRDHLTTLQRERDTFLPWRDGRRLPATLQRRADALPVAPRYRDLPAAYRALRRAAAALPADAETTGDAAADAGTAAATDAAAARRLRDDLDAAEAALRDLEHDRLGVVAECERYLREARFEELYDARRDLFRLGYRVDEDRPDEHAYDLLASEARIGSFVAIALHRVPPRHWLHLGRPFAEVGDRRVLLSWSGSMFEYLMPPLLLRSPPDSLLGEALAAAVDRQIAYGRAHGIPWGVSESAYARTDVHGTYQYRAFGVPDLALSREAAGRPVVAPYASLMALPLRPAAAAANLRRLAGEGALGRYGFYDALDYAPEHLPPGERCTVVRSFMAHHHGMGFLALCNLLDGERFPARVHADRRVQACEVLLHEGVAPTVPLERLERRAAPERVRERPPLHATVGWPVPIDTAAPQLHTLSNGRLTSAVTAAGGGFLRWRGIDLTRWRGDAVQDAWGTWLYLHDEELGAVRSLGRQPCGRPADEEHVRFWPHRVELHRRDGPLVARLDVAVAPSDDVEIRLVTLANHSDAPRTLTVASFAEVALAPHGSDLRHPAFAKLFVESARHDEVEGISFRRRPRGADEAPAVLLHRLVRADPDAAAPAEVETDRARLLGRHGDAADPPGLRAGRLAGDVGATLDPAMALRSRVAVPPHGEVRLAFLTMAGRSREALLDVARRYGAWDRIDAALADAEGAQARALQHLELDEGQMERVQRVLSRLLYPGPWLRAEPATLAANRRGQRGLWAHGVPGDDPLLVVRVREPGDLELARTLLKAHRLWRGQGLAVELVLLNERDRGYAQSTQGLLRRMIAAAGDEAWLDRPGGVFLLTAARLSDDDRTLLLAAARAVVGGAGEGEEPLPPPEDGEPPLPPLAPTRAPERPDPTPPLPRPSDLHFDNGYGGLAADGREYRIHLDGRPTPAPWCNVLASETFGTLLSESGTVTSWYGNSGEARLTPWSNDPLRDQPGEALYLRDEETAEVWSPTPRPAPAETPYLVRRGIGRTVVEHRSHRLAQRLETFVCEDRPAKVVRLRLENLAERPRRLTVTCYLAWLLGAARERDAATLVPSYDAELGALLARNPFLAAYPGLHAVLAGDRPPHGVGADRLAFLGRRGDPARPAALGRIGLSERVEAGRDPCAALQLHVDLPAGGRDEVAFLIGAAEDREAAGRLVRELRAPGALDAAWRTVERAWAERLDAVRVATPDPAMDALLNGWLLYQTLACRLWGRSAFYQSSGAFGFRDQLQDALALLHAMPGLARAQLRRAARHQFEEGDVLHWWHPPDGAGVRTRISDDLAWLPYALARYLEATGDDGVLDEREPYLAGPELAADEHERYDLYPASERTGTIYEHALRALDRACTEGPHGLPRIGGGDWNDGMNRVGVEGRGESVWLAWFLIAVLRDMAPRVERRGDARRAEQLRARAERYRAAVEAHAWDGGWYLRAFYDDGTPLGSHDADEARIDAIAQAWAVLSGAADPQRARRALDAAYERLVRPEDGLVLLLTPPFDRGGHDPGYIQGYLPGVRENGGQYTHAAIWLAWAFARRGDAERAYALWRMLTPLRHAEDRAAADRYRVEPYVVAADVYGVPPHVGRGGWTWYTGSAGWLYRLGLEAILGVRRRGDALEVAPCVPASWPGYEVEVRAGRARYRIVVENPDRVAGGGVRATLDGAPLPGAAIPLCDDGASHEARVRIVADGAR